MVNHKKEKSSERNSFFRFVSHSSVETKSIGRIFGREILGTKPGKTALVLRLEGDLGSGKTTFLQGLAKGLGVKDMVLSPTFVVMRRLKINHYSGLESCFVNFYHFDCYRISSQKELSALSLKEIIDDPRNIVAIEWAERIRKFPLKNSVLIKFKFIDSKTRIVSFKK